MTQNRKQLIDLFIGNIANVIVHKILEEAIEDEIIRKHYDKELLISLEVAKKYREKINPINTSLPDKDIEYLKNKIKRKVTSELQKRIKLGYENINIEGVDNVIEEFLSTLKIT